MTTYRALEIGNREWGNIRASLDNCGDIGEFLSDSRSANGKADGLTISKGLHLLRNLLEMDKKLPTYGYYTPEAALVFSALGYKAGKRLGLNCDLAEAFGSGYSLVRTGSFAPNDISDGAIKLKFFLNTFFPVGGHVDWDFNSQDVKAKLELIFNLFNKWQNQPNSYSGYCEIYRKTAVSLEKFGLIFRFSRGIPRNVILQ